MSPAPSLSRRAALAAVAALGIAPLQAAASADPWSRGAVFPPDLRLIDGEGRRFAAAIWARGVVVLRVGGLWCPPCVAERPSAEAFAAAHPAVPVFLIAAAAPGRTVDHAFEQELADARRRGRPLAGILRRDPDGPRAPPPSVVPHTLVLRDGVAIESLSGRQSYEGRRESMSEAALSWRAYVEAALICAGGPLVRRAVLPEAERLAARRAADACRT